MKTEHKFISPLSSGEFQATVQPDVVKGVLPDVDAYFADMLAHFSRFAVGNYAWFVADRLKGKTHSAGGNIEEVCGVHTEELIGAGPELIFGRTHPDDLPKMLAFSAQWTNFLGSIDADQHKHYVPCIFIRLLSGRGTYRWVMVQFLDSFLDSQGNALYTFTAITDIAHIKHTGEAMMTIRNVLGNSSVCYHCLDNEHLTKHSYEKQKITSREQEVLRLLAKGLGSKQIADELGLSIHTVNNHRRSLLIKASAKSTAELVSYGVRMGHLSW